MAQRELTIEECKATEEALTEVMKAFPKGKAMDFIGHFNDIFLFLGAVKRHLETEKQ